MPYDIVFKSYCWSVGTTSFRTKHFNEKIEEQLLLLKEFFEFPENRNETWSRNTELQTKYYNFLKDKNFIRGNESRPDKFAREKTSSLESMGLIDSERRLTEVGIALSKLSENKTFIDNNDLNIDGDSYIFTKQLLKTSKNIDGNIVRPYIVLIYILSKLKYLTKDEFMYCLPLCINNTTTLKIIESIEKLRLGQITLDEIIIDIILSKNNYKKAKELFLSNNVTEDLICLIGMNRNSGHGGSERYDKIYYALYKELKEVCVNKNNDKLANIVRILSSDDFKLSAFWKKLLFTTSRTITLLRNPLIYKTDTEIYNVNNESEFKNIFFNLMHLYKVKATLHDYCDVNKRFFNLTETIIFEDEKVQFDIIPKYYFGDTANQLYESAFEESALLVNNCSINEIFPSLSFDINNIYRKIQDDFDITITDENDIKSLIKNNRLTRFRKLIEDKFDIPKLLQLLDCFEERNDEQIYKLVTDNANVPTIFEYIVGIIWYIISGFEGDILEFMNLSLQSNLLPKSHAGGGISDIIYKYSPSEYYPKHSLLLECTLMEGTTQRQGEMEPVSRHLCNYMLDENINAYCSFVSNNLHASIISDFRMRKGNRYYRNDTEYVESMKIIPLHIKDLKTILEKQIVYKDVYTIFDAAYNSDEQDAPNWYKTQIKEKMAAL